VKIGISHSLKRWLNLVSQI